jgi:PAS domain S-box-containing protein
VRPGEPTVLDDVNRAFCATIGTEAGSLRSSPLSDVVDQIDDAIDSLIRRGSPTCVPAACVAADGHATRMLVHMSSLGDEDGSHLVLLQITEETVARETERALRESEKRVQDLVDNVNTLIYIKATDGSYILVNRHFEEMFGISRFDAPLCTNIDFFPPHIAEIYSANDAKVLQTGVPMEFEEPRADGGAWLTLKFPLFDVDGDIYAVGGISTDISHRRREELLARRAKDEAERANEAKSQFLSRMSHELRTPLNSILGFGQLLQLQVPPGPRRESVDRIVMAGRHLLALINEVLEISRIEAHASQHEVEPVDVCRPLTDAVELLRPLAQERGIDIVQDLHGGLYRCVLADPQRLTQVLLNVLSNAIKYNRIGGSVRISFRDVPGARLRLCIADTGHGIPPESLEKVFMPFERVGADRTATEGTGLGLTLSRSLIEEMGGSIGIERSDPGEGTVFHVDLPLAPANTVPASGYFALRDGDPLEAVGVVSGTVLYVEDNLANLDVVNGLFGRVGDVRVIPAVQGHVGIELAASCRPDLVLLDLHLPDLDGDEVLRRLRADPRTADIPVIVLSADATRDQIERLKLAGAVDYVTKPIDVSVFLRAVKTALAG